MKEFSIKKVFLLSVQAYRKEWKLLLLISFISTGITLSCNSLTIILTSLFEASLLQSLLLVGNFVLMIVGVYFLSRLTVSLMIASKGSLDSADESLSSCYEKAKHTTWKFIKITFLLVLILLIPLLFIIFGIIWVKGIGDSTFFRVIIILVGLLAILYLYTNFYFSIYMAGLRPGIPKALSYSKRLVKGNFFKVLLIMLMPFVITVPIGFIGYSRDINELSVGIRILYYVVRTIPNIFLTPFTILLSLVSLKRLEDIKKTDSIAENITE